MKTLLSTSYWPNLRYMRRVLLSDSVIIEQFEHYGKQSFRNRCEVLSANGILRLSIPVRKLKLKEQIHEVEISYQEKWQARHWGAISSAYRNSPYFEFFEDKIRRFYFETFPTLMEYNTEQLRVVLDILNVKRQVKYSSVYEKTPPNSDDQRGLVLESNSQQTENNLPLSLRTPYYQTFGDKFGFVPNLSILDILFNTGLETKDYLSLAD
jgi:hypothetical protein